jgi:hypothetical protein
MEGESSPPRATAKARVNARTDLAPRALLITGPEHPNRWELGHLTGERLPRGQKVVALDAGGTCAVRNGEYHFVDSLRLVKAARRRSASRKQPALTPEVPPA